MKAGRLTVDVPGGVVVAHVTEDWAEDGEALFVDVLAHPERMTLTEAEQLAAEAAEETQRCSIS